MSPNGVKCAGAMTRDVAVYCVSIASVLIAFAVGTVSADYAPSGCVGFGGACICQPCPATHTHEPSPRSPSKTCNP